ncbi:MAG: nitrilase-related carbon-nitrogen hydrolase [Spirochaetota bacterium]
MKKYRFCGLQIETTSHPSENLKKIKALFNRASRAEPDFVVLPEMFEIAPVPSEASGYSHPIPSQLTDTLGELAREHSVNLIGGSFFEEEDHRIYNTAVVFDREGRICGKYRKIHLFDAFGYGESDYITRGQTPFVYELDGLRFGVAICYDVRFPEIFRLYAAEGAQVVFVPAAYFQPNHDHWHLNIRSRALDNTIFVMSSNQTGKRFVGRSMTANPWGISIASMGIEEGYYMVEIDVDIIGKTRKKLPFLENMQFKVSPST